MNDEFLHRLRKQPTLGFATALKAKLDLQSAAAATRRRFVYLLSSVVIGATALAFVTPSFRQFVGTRGPEPSNVQGSAAAQMERNARMSSSPPALANALEEKGDAPQSIIEERTNAMTGSPVAFEAQQAIEALSNPIRLPRATHTSTPTPLSASDIAMLPGGRIRVDGMRATLAILKAVGEELKNLTLEKIRVSTETAGISDGFLKLCRGDIDVYGTTRPISKQEMKVCSTSSVPFIELPIAYEAMVVIVNSQATWIDEITTADLKKIWEPSAQGRMVRWNQLNAAWPDRFFQLYGSASNSSVRDYFIDAIIGVPRTMRADYIGSDFFNYVTNGVSQYSGAIGFLHYTSDIVPASQVKALKIVNAAGVAVSPSESAFVDASYNPLSRPLFIYVNAECAKRPEIQAFVKYLLTQGAKSIRKANGVPLPDDMYESVLARFTRGKTGTVFDGQPAIGVPLDEALTREPAQ